MKKTEKAFFVENLAEELKKAKSSILVNYSGLSVSMQQDLKKELKGVGARMLVVKNTLFKLAGEKAKIPQETLEDSVLEGQNALILADEDPIAPLQILANFSVKHETPQFRVGIVEGYYHNQEALEKLSKFSGKDALFGQVLGTIASPTYGLIGVLQNNLNSLVYILSEASKK